MNVSGNLTAFFISVAAALVAPSLQASSNPLVSNIAADAAINAQTSFAACYGARPDAYRDICDRFVTSLGIERCIETGRGAYFSECSLGVCQRFATEDGALKCLDAARNKVYSTAEVEVCNSYVTEYYTIECMKRSGAPYVDQDSALRRVRQDIELALEDLYAGRTRQATLLLEDTLRQIDAASDSVERK